MKGESSGGGSSLGGWIQSVAHGADEGSRRSGAEGRAETKV